ncbi:MAG: radical SAM family heme chaperone HemW [Proteobacteria bacterium]|nr:radical SAM family heme chaperone HemW [Pseudomonadota bacterium]
MSARPPFDAGFGVYVHWPFCASKCPYCDFNSHVRHHSIDEARFVAGFRRELAGWRDLAPDRTVSSIFFGGGTPSLMKPETVAGILGAIRDFWPVTPDCEVTLEANPTSVEATRFRGYREAGVNRVSLGVQSLNDTELAFLGRKHTVAEALRAIEVAATTFDRFSFDLIYARPGQTPEAWSQELKEALRHAPHHLSLYQLTIEPDTAFDRLASDGKLVVPKSDAARALYDTTQAICNAAGLPAYEISNHARPGEECRHNLLYWRYGEYVGTGPGAHGRIVTADGRQAIANEKIPERWLETVERKGMGDVAREVLTRENEADEFLLMGLRLSEGIDTARFERLRGAGLDEARIADLEGYGFVARDGNGRLRVTPEGFPVLDAVVADLAA